MFKALLPLLLTPFISMAADPETLVISFQKQKNPQELAAATKNVSEYLEKALGKKVEVLVPTSYGATAQGLISGKVHVAYMDSLPFILASKEAELEVLAVEKRKGLTQYDSLIVVAKNSPIKTLSDLKGKSFAFTSQTSTSGFLFPFARLIQDKIISTPEQLQGFFSKTVYAGGYDKALAAVASGQVDAAAFSDYAFEGPKADLYGTAEIRSKVQILTRTSGVPTHLITASKALSAELRSKLQKALLQLGKDKPELLSSVYGAAELTVPETKVSHVDKTLKALASTKLDAGVFVK